MNQKIRFCGFDKVSSSQLIVEAKKYRDVKYDFDFEYEFNKNSRYNSIDLRIKIYIFKKISKFVDLSILILTKLKINKIIKFLLNHKNNFRLLIK